MKNNLFALSLKAGSVNRRVMQFILLLVSLILFVLGAGAPAEVGSVGG